MSDRLYRWIEIHGRVHDQIIRQLEEVALTICDTCHGDARLWHGGNIREWHPCPGCLPDRDGNPSGYILDTP